MYREILSDFLSEYEVYLAFSIAIRASYVLSILYLFGANISLTTFSTIPKVFHVFLLAFQMEYGECRLGSKYL